ncbi:MAG TPA: IMP cyclohydrolase [Candidatus Methylomirabilis sp.]|nr:IMP cyclohydrolase [Candidatus Methylomirabilis sp.]
MCDKVKVLDQADRNLQALKANRYPGRGLIVGLSQGGLYLVQVYWIMGRSASSRNRIFISDDPTSLRTVPIDVAKIENPGLLIYRAMAEFDKLYVVSNGDQTETVISTDKKGMFFEQGMRCRDYEPDAPNYTPRITAIFSRKLGYPAAEILVLKKSEFGIGCDRFLYRYEEFHPGLGRCVTTYSGDGDPLPSFCGEPYLLPLHGDIDEVARTIWSALDTANRVALAVKFIDKEGKEPSVIKIINAYRAVA